MILPPLLQNEGSWDRCSRVPQYNGEPYACEVLVATFRPVDVRSPRHVGCDVLDFLGEQGGEGGA